MNLDDVIEFYKFQPGRHDFYRCAKCNSLFTREQEQERFLTFAGNKKAYIHCNSLRYGPGHPFWYDWARPAVLRYAIKVLLVRVVAAKYPRLRNVALRLAGNKATR